MKVFSWFMSILDWALGPRMAHGDWLGGPDIEDEPATITKDVVPAADETLNNETTKQS